MNRATAAQTIHPAQVPGPGRGAHAAVVVFGEALIDDFADGPVIGGAPFNVARALSCFGCHPLMITRTGQDHFADLISQQFERFQMHRDGWQCDCSYPTGLVTVREDQGGHTFQILPDQAYDHISADEAAVAMKDRTVKIVYFGTLAQRDMTSWSALQAVLRATKARRFLDLNLREGQVKRSIILDTLQQADTLKINAEEFGLLADMAFGSVGTSAQEPLAFRGTVQRLMQAFSLSEMIVTLGDRGYRYFDRHGMMLSGSTVTMSAPVRDTVGAGDAFSAAFLTGVYHDWPIQQSLDRANCFAASVCSVRGAVSTDLGFYQNWIERWFGASARVFQPYPLPRSQEPT